MPQVGRDLALGSADGEGRRERPIGPHQSALLQFLATTGRYGLECGRASSPAVLDGYTEYPGTSNPSGYDDYGPFIDDFDENRSRQLLYLQLPPVFAMAEGNGAGSPAGDVKTPGRCAARVVFAHPILPQALQVLLF
jgi:hypothetical protein